MTDLESLQLRKGALHLLEDSFELQVVPLEDNSTHVVIALL
jgi:hypothetical protein